MANNKINLSPMRLIGYWKTSPSDQELFPPLEFLGTLPEADRILLGDYLSNGSERKRYRGYSHCRFCNQYNGSREFSDGYWVWPEGFAHYILEHGVVVPEEFLQHVKSGTPPLPKSVWPSEVDISYWKSWCRANISADYWNRFASGRDQAILNKAKVEKIASLVAAHGLSDQRCQWAGCSNLALKGLAQCAACAMK